MVFFFPSRCIFIQMNLLSQISHMCLIVNICVQLVTVSFQVMYEGVYIVLYSANAATVDIW